MSNDKEVDLAEMMEKMVDKLPSYRESFKIFVPRAALISLGIDPENPPSGVVVVDDRVSELGDE